ncbi:MAG TPA: hypothetical protein PL134_02165 [Smithellaceae bacterium]|nr:hypothetical protein [Smithellaceae bacterium]HNZ32205.1 hypothetical protein [Smithellaceae bacterium]HOZ60611.1 hypothetical protein [Smithellaceae bacterium]HPG53177.1 hypothetical protein [Smithellaceae bacterium]HPM70542.1 hypothetical protein [Smithellaceae bacterium]
MFNSTKRNQGKIDEIRMAPELLRIDAQYARGEGALKLFLLLLVALLFVYHEGLIGMLKEKTTQQQIVLVGMILLFMTALVFTLYMMKRRKGKTLVMTEKGLFMETSFALFWRDINEYGWNFSSAMNNFLFSGQKRGASLLLVKNKGVWPKMYDLAPHGIFFTPQQMQQVDDLFRRLGIKKAEG